MENTELHGQKLAILSRLIKDSSLTLEEALILLQDEPVETQQETVAPQAPHWNPWQNPLTSPGTINPWRSSGSGTTLGSMMFSNSSNTLASLSTQPAEADLNN